MVTAVKKTGKRKTTKKNQIVKWDAKEKDFDEIKVERVNPVNLGITEYSYLDLNCDQLLFDSFGAIQELSKMVISLQTQINELKDI